MPEEFRVAHPETNHSVVAVRIEDAVSGDRREEIRALAIDLAEAALEAAGVNLRDGLTTETVEILTARAPETHGIRHGH